MRIALLIIAIVLAGLGALFLSNATSGVGLISLACLCAILARISQADEHQRELKALLKQRDPQA